MTTHLIFVYNADSGLYNTLADAAHKVFAPSSYSCNLCQVTYGWFTERRDWRDFIANLGAETEFLHRDQFRRRFPSSTSPFPPCSTCRTASQRSASMPRASTRAASWRT